MFMFLSEWIMLLCGSGDFADGLAHKAVSAFETTKQTFLLSLESVLKEII